MYRCLSCDKTFSDLKSENDYDGFDYGAQRSYGVCPNCGSEDIDEQIGTCESCGDEIYESDRYYKVHNSRSYFGDITYFCEYCVEEVDN